MAIAQVRIWRSSAAGGQPVANGARLDEVVAQPARRARFSAAAIEPTRGAGSSTGRLGTPTEAVAPPSTSWLSAACGRGAGIARSEGPRFGRGLRRRQASASGEADGTAKLTLRLGHGLVRDDKPAGAGFEGT